MSRPKIPPDIKLAVRQKCGFCCVICGCPVYDYDHIEEYATEQKHDANNLVLLCPTCHRKKTNGLISKGRIREAIEDVRNTQRTGPDDIERKDYFIEIGTNLIRSCHNKAFSIHGFGDLSINYDHGSLINANLYDANGEKAIEIINNEYTLCKSTWDIEWEGKELTFRNRPRDVFAKLIFNVDVM